MWIANNLRTQLREALYKHVPEPSLDLLLSDEFGLRFRQIVRDTLYDVQCLDVIQWAESGGKLHLLCTGLQRHEHTKGNASLQKTVSAILTALDAPMRVSTTADGRVILLNNRPFLDRLAWALLQTFTTQQGLDRLLLITGEKATGKSYSEFLIGYCAGLVGVEFVSLRVPPSEGELTAASLADAIADRLWPDAPLRRFDDLGQESRAGKWYGDRLVGKLSVNAQPTWIVIDGFNEVDLAQSAVELLIRLCHAVELELKQHWLVLVGLDPEKLGSEYESLVPSDKASGPASQHVIDYINTIAASAGRALSTEDVEMITQELCGTLGLKPTHESWRSFHRLLTKRCKAIKEGRPVWA